MSEVTRRDAIKLAAGVAAVAALPASGSAAQNPGVVDPIVSFHERKGVSSVRVVIRAADNEFTVALNDKLIKFGHFRESNKFDENITDRLRPGLNVLVISCDNHGYPFTDPNPAGLEGEVEVNNERINISQTTSNRGIRQGLYCQAIFALVK